jgi:hypothetical protein
MKQFNVLLKTEGIYILLWRFFPPIEETSSTSTRDQLRWSISGGFLGHITNLTGTVSWAYEYL